MTDWMQFSRLTVKIMHTFRPHIHLMISRSRWWRHRRGEGRQDPDGDQHKRGGRGEGRHQRRPGGGHWGQRGELPSRGQDEHHKPSQRRDCRGDDDDIDDDDDNDDNDDDDESLSLHNSQVSTILKQIKERSTFSLSDYSISKVLFYISRNLSWLSWILINY